MWFEKFSIPEVLSYSQSELWQYRITVLVYDAAFLSSNIPGEATEYLNTAGGPWKPQWFTEVVACSTVKLTLVLLEESTCTYKTHLSFSHCMNQNPWGTTDIQTAIQVLFEGLWCTKPGSVLSWSAHASGFPPSMSSHSKAGIGSLRTNADSAHEQILSRKMKVSNDFFSLCPLAHMPVEVFAAQVKFSRGIWTFTSPEFHRET